MSSLQVANIHLESTANNRVQYTGSNTVSLVAGGANIFTINSTSANVSTNTFNLGSSSKAPSANGYTYLPNGLLFQWMLGTSSGALGNNVTLNYPVTFPNALVLFTAGTVGASNTGGTNYTVVTATGNTSQSRATISANGVPITSTQAWFFALGY